MANIFTKLGVGIKSVAEKVSSGVKNVVNTAGKVLQNAGKNVQLAPLVPLIPMMKNLLKAKGINPPSALDDLANMFYQVIILKKTQISKFDLDPVTLGVIIPLILEFIKKITDKKDAGAVLTPEEQKVSDQVDKLADDLAAKDDNSVMKQVLIGAGVLVGLALIGFLIYKLSNK